jgi:hypothetical protein
MTPEYELNIENLRTRYTHHMKLPPRVYSGDETNFVSKTHQVYDLLLYECFCGTILMSTIALYKWGSRCQLNDNFPIITVGIGVVLPKSI